ncbi:uncharacterized protein L969DRAFT_525350 [Mixia osmundae IAM 14324]|uniref:Protein BCP1 n=1 Tax=Mixia osmundae (strain CBS 9802 / IAM 14324 / JCM 22182 / KY 12970) TaxID=764103 RepID=G7DZ61_MIXOS|nr:uncharacterized protein L969DRAFT_525350 [Mixia osmundae IAM 14324]KEI38272.1 hypothetical protein L969DRAFT_525350 [Mixia osmundae IAM 14324]GAA95871.1 hypothetical protein E5Q_02528 [Mixia osmundae IAM 14324]
MASTDDEQQELVDVTFDFFGLEAVDYHGIRALLNQLLAHDASLIRTEALADWLVAPTQTGVAMSKAGTTVKTDGEASDPLALCAYVPLCPLPANTSDEATAALAGLTSWLAQRVLASTAQSRQGLRTIDEDIAKTLAQRLSAAQSAPSLGLIVSERLLNMPAQIVAPLLRITLEDMASIPNANDKDAQILLLSRIYVAASEDDADDLRFAQASQDLTNGSTPKKRRKAKTPKKQAQEAQLYPYHVEDEILAQNAKHVLDFAYQQAPARTQEAEGLDFGVEMFGTLMLFDRSSLDGLVGALEQAGSST